MASDAPIAHDETVEPDESFWAGLTSATGAKMVVRGAEASVRNNDVDIWLDSDVSVHEDGGTLHGAFAHVPRFVQGAESARRSGLRPSVLGNTADGEGGQGKFAATLANNDYERVQDRTIELVRDGALFPISVKIIFDQADEPKENFFFEISADPTLVGTVTIKRAKATIFILNDD